MKIIRRWLTTMALCMFLVGLSGCGSTGSKTAEHKVIIPEAPGKEVLTGENLTVDISNQNQGYMMVCYTGSADQLYLQLTGPDETEYKYFLTPSEQYTAFPFTAGNGAYVLYAYEHIGDNQFSPIFSQTLTIELDSEFGPFLCSSQYVDFTMDSKAVAQAEELAQDNETDLETVQNIYNWVIQNVEYDYDKAATVESGYLPNVDETLKSGKGICFDFAALMTAMLRSRNIPARLNIGYLTEDVYHAWISVYLDETGWVDNIIQFDGKDWQLLDPTVASSSGSTQVQEMVSDQDNYIVRYIH